MYYFIVQFNHIFNLQLIITFSNIFGSSVNPHSHPSLVLNPGIICTFPIHSGSLQKMLTALFNLVQNTQKTIWTIFFEYQGKVFLSIEKILEKISQDQP